MPLKCIMMKRLCISELWRGTACGEQAEQLTFTPGFHWQEI